eukprot:TRINITY_DN5532_c0_g2_i9.p1 TRINITY_DN5532_c0_g2~~TRINITY_DN5532_c0_g2_i9.p1  ORF type:complete len:250 (-),score=70.68 TRINITY_DN5532_c0_g2_i9:138-887(-)
MAAPPMTVVISFDDTVDLTDESLPEPLITPRSQAIEDQMPRRTARKSLSDWWAEGGEDIPERPTPLDTQVYSWEDQPHTELELQQMQHIEVLQSQLQNLQQRLEMEQQMRAEAEEVSPALPVKEAAVAAEEEPEMAVEESLSSSEGEPAQEMLEQEELLRQQKALRRKNVLGCTQQEIEDFNNESAWTRMKFVLCELCNFATDPDQDPAEIEAKAHDEYLKAAGFTKCACDRGERGEGRSAVAASLRRR